MEDFLTSSSAAAKTSFHGNQRVHIVLGSESCDLDSVVSSLVMAYFLSRTSDGCLALPLLSVPRSQFHLRADVLLLLREAGITMETLVFRDEVDLARLHEDRRLALTLVDHSVLLRTDSGLEGAVVEVIDHHPLERTTSFFCPDTVETVVSCTTLVTERILSRAPEILDRQVALLLYGAMVDSVNQTVKGSQMVQLLQTQFPDLPHRGALHAALRTTKFDLSGLSTEQILLKDMKMVAGSDVAIAVSIVYMSLDSFLCRMKLQQELQDFCHSHRLDAVVAMTISFNDQSDEPVRQLMVYSPSSQCRQEISHALLNTWGTAPFLSPVSSPYKDIQAYHQSNASTSRTKLLSVLTHLRSDWWRREVHCGGDGDKEEREEELDQSDTMISDAFPVCKESLADITDDRPAHVYLASRHNRRRLQFGAEEYGNMEEDYCGRMMPPVPMNSLVDGCPLDGCFNQEALLEKFSRMGGLVEERGGSGQWRGGGGGGDEGRGGGGGGGKT